MEDRQMRQLALIRRQLHSRPLAERLRPLGRYSASLNCDCTGPMWCVCEIPFLLRAIAGKWRRSSCGPIVVAIVSIILTAYTRAFGFTIADLDPSHHYKLEKIDLSGAHA